MKKLSELGLETEKSWRAWTLDPIDPSEDYSVFSGGFEIVECGTGEYGKKLASFIAAAPDLYKEAWELVTAFDERVMTPGHVEALRAALAKASGESEVKK